MIGVLSNRVYRHLFLAQGVALVGTGLATERRPELTLGLAANNIFDVVARRLSSLRKDYAPLAGRD